MIYDMRFTINDIHMLGKLSDWDDTIVALATAPGIGALGVIRLSGPSAVSIANQLFPSKESVRAGLAFAACGTVKKGWRDPG